MELWEAFATVALLAALIALSIYQDRKPRTLGRTTMVPWIGLGIAATAAELVMVMYTVTLAMH